jgi:hypothetical protein
VQELRASDADRDWAVRALRHHHLAGRLDVDTFESRVERANEATLMGDLTALLADLPAEVRASRGASEEVTTGTPRWPGTRPFEERKILESPVDEVADRVRDIIAPTLERVDYALVHEDDRTFVFAFRYRPAWTYWAAVFAFPVGLIALLSTREDRVTIRLGRAGPYRTRMLVYGRASLPLRKAFASLSD